MLEVTLMRSESGKLMQVWEEDGWVLATPADPDDWAAGCVERVCRVGSPYLDSWTIDRA